MSILDTATREQLRRLQRKEKDRRTYIKVTVMLMLDLGLSPMEIGQYLGIDDSTVYRYHRGFDEVGLEKYLDTHYQPYAGKLKKEEEAWLQEALRQDLYITSQEIIELVKAEFKVVYSVSGMTQLLHRLGYSYKKTKSVPSKGEVELQQAFVEKFDKMMETLPADNLVFFNDGVHPQHNTRSDYGWIRKGKDFEMPANAGRSRINLNGALNAQDVSDIVVREDETINSDSNILLWETLHKKHPGKQLIQICDNAGYNKSKKIQQWLSDNKWCKVIYLPPYSPNLNLIERLWKFLRKQVISYYFYEKFSEFRTAVLTFFDKIQVHKKALESLLTLNFHIRSAA